jgi:hypothetical protein
MSFHACAVACASLGMAKKRPEPVWAAKPASSSFMVPFSSPEMQTTLSCSVCFLAAASFSSSSFSASSQVISL